MELMDYLTEELILTGIDAANAEDAIRSVAQALYTTGYVKASYADAVLARETTFPTGIENEGYNFAIPHTDLDHVNKPAIAIATLRNPVEFARMDAENETTDVRLIFMLAITEPDKQIGALRSLMQLLQDHQFYNDLCQCSTPDAMLALIQKKTA